MTKTHAQAILKEIRDCRSEPEFAQALEIELHISALNAIANGTSDDPKGLARVALQSRKIKFARRYV